MEIIVKYQKISNKFRKELRLKKPKDNWLYVSNEIKKQAIINTGYEVKDNYIIAYKGIRKDFYSNYNFQYKYELNEIYEAHCDYNLDNENSFGLSAWTLEKATKYCNQQIIKVKIHISDIGALVHDGFKIRCSKLTVIEIL